MAQNYLLNRDASESKRLTQQHEHWAKSLGYLIHPTIASALPSDAAIADIGTGTGIWALAVSRERPQSQCFGFDISPAQFVALDSLPSNVHLHVHDLRQPFPQEMRGRFDVVHARLLVLAMADQEAWTSAVRNLSMLLTPGGWLQWEDGDFQSVRSVVREPSGAPMVSTNALRKGFGLLLSLTHPRLGDVPKKMLTAFKDGGLENVDVDTVASDRLPEYGRKLSTRMEIGAAEGVLKQHRDAVQAGTTTATPIPGTSDDDAELVRQMYEEAENGAYCVFFIECLRGQKRH